MKKFLQISFLILFCLIFVSSKKFQLSSRYQISCRKDTDLKVAKENFIICLGKLLKDESRKEDKEMMEEIAKSFVEEKHMDRFSDGQIDEFIKREIEDYVENWKRNMYIRLIDDMLKIEYDREFLDVMLKDPDFYGLTYDSYRILNFKFEEN